MTPTTTSNLPGDSAGGPVQPTDAAHPLPRSPRHGRSVAASWVRNLGRLALLALVAAAILYWLRLRPIAVRTHVVQTGPLLAEVLGTGTLEARRQAVISPEIAGRITEVSVDQGNRVQAGQVLVRLDDEDLGRQVEVSASNLAAARAGVDRQAAERERALAVLDQAEIDFGRIEDLAGQGSASSFEMDKANEARRVAEAEVNRSQAALVEADKQVIAAARTLDFHRARLADSVITAPFDGLIVRRDRDPGSVVVPGSAILVLIATEELWISAWVDETEMARLQPGQPARVVFRSDPERSYPGEVARLGREADRETREFLADVWVRDLPANWAVGQRAEVYIQVAHKDNVTLLPADLLARREGQSGAFVATAGRARWRDVQLGLRGRHVAEVLNGLEAGELVVFTPGTKAPPLEDGQRITLP